MIIKQPISNTAERPIVASRMLGASPQGSQTDHWFVTEPAKDRAYAGAGRCAAQPDMGLVTGRFGKVGFSTGNPERLLHG